jgi:hypothetical protein
MVTSKTTWPFASAAGGSEVELGKQVDNRFAEEGLGSCDSVIRAKQKSTALPCVSTAR